jgi:hypothetical protein
MILFVFTLIYWNQCTCRRDFGSFIDDPEFDSFIDDREEPRYTEDTEGNWLQRILRKITSKRTSHELPASSSATTTAPATPAYRCFWKICSRPLNKVRHNRFSTKDTNKSNKYNKYNHVFFSLGFF